MDWRGLRKATLTASEKAEKSRMNQRLSARPNDAVIMHIYADKAGIICIICIICIIWLLFALIAYSIALFH